MDVPTLPWPVFTVHVTRLLFRHGDRSPVKAYPTDPYQESAWPQGFGQLSQEGMRQHYNLGQFLRGRYKGFLNETYDRREVHVRSTDYDRTLMSAEANLAALYPPSGQQVFNPDLKWQPIPVHTVPQDQETLLSFPTDKCPRYKQLMAETEKSPEFVNMTTKYSDFMEMVHNKTGQLSTSVETVWSVYDTLFCESRHNLTAPAWVTEDVMDKLKILKDFAFQIMFDIYKHQEKCRLQGGEFVFVCHDTTVVALQSSMSVFNGIQPPYASCHMIELYREDNGSMSVSMFYRNDSSLPEPYPVALPGCSQDCPLEDYIRITGPFIPDDLEKECQVPSAFNDKEVVVALAVSSALLIFLLVLITALLCRRKQPITSQGYRHVTNQEGLGGEYHS
uniref:Lysosomal acid phosphatase n=1 Tax=Gadus morhua TaxID=8049 RepID=A0A8C4ZHD5_GADMO